MEPTKYSAREALKVIDGGLSKELGIHRFDDINRSKAQLFAIGGTHGRQFAIVLGNTDVVTGFHPAQQTRIVLEKCVLPSLPGIEACNSPYEGSRVKNNQDSRLAAPNQTSCLVRDNKALDGLIRWYAKLPGGGGGQNPSTSLERTRIEKAAIDAGFDLTPEEAAEGWLVFKSSAFPIRVGVLARTEGYDFGVSDSFVGLRLSADLGIQRIPQAKPWETRLNGIASYNQLHQALQRGAQIAQALSSNPLNEFLVKAKQIPDTTEVQRLVKQRVGQDIFRRELIGYWGGKCAATGLDLVELLRASHIKPWAKCDSDDERLDVFNGLLLAPNLDALFDGGWVSFLDSGHICVSGKLNTQQRILAGLSGDEHVKGLTVRHLGYLEWHRDKLFRKT